MNRRRTWGPLLAALACAASPLLAAPRAPRARAAAAREYSLPEGRFSVKVPAGWTASRDPREDERQKVFGVLLSGPRGADGVLSTISLAYYPPGNALFKGGEEEFLKRNLGSDSRFVAPEGESTSPVEETALGGLPAKSFTRRTHESVPPDRMDGKQVAVLETVEVAAAKPGFYVVAFKRSERSAAKLTPVYARLRSSLSFGLAKQIPNTDLRGYPARISR